MISWLVNNDIYYWLGGVLEETAVSNGTYVVLGIIFIAICAVCFSKKLRNIFF